MIGLCVLLFPGLVCPLEVSVSSGSIQVARGQTAVLPCTFTTNAALTNLNVIWMVIPLSNANQPQQVGLFSLEHVFPWGFPVSQPVLDVGPLQCLLSGCTRTSLSVHCWACRLDIAWVCFLQRFVNRCPLCPRWMCSWGKCMWYYVSPRASCGLCVQKSTGDVIQVFVHWMWNLEGLGVPAALNLWNLHKISSNTTSHRLITPFTSLLIFPLLVAFAIPFLQILANKSI